MFLKQNRGFFTYGRKKNGTSHQLEENHFKSLNGSQSYPLQKISKSQETTLETVPHLFSNISKTTSHHTTESQIVRRVYLGRTQRLGRARVRGGSPGVLRLPLIWVPFCPLAVWDQRGVT